MKQREIEEAIEREVGEWPDATVTFANGGKHPKAKLTFGGKIKAVAFSATPGSVLSIHHTLADIRRTLRQLGAERPKPEPTKEEDEAPYRPKNDGAEKRPHPVEGERAAVKPTLGDQLVQAGAVSATVRDGAVVPESVRIDGKSAEDLKAAAQAEGSARTYATRAEAQATVDELRKAFEARVAGIVDGIYFGLPADVYHAVPRLSSSGIQKLCVSPGTFWRGSWLDPDRPDPDEEETVWQVLGRAYHTARLEPHLFEHLYVRELDKADCPEGTLFTANDMSKQLEDYGLKKSGSVLEQAERLADAGYPTDKLWPLIKQAWEHDRGSRAPLPAKHYDQMLTDRDRISANSQIAPLLTGGEAEVSIFWTDQHGVQMKARVDYLTRDHWADFKTFDNSRGKNLEQALADAVRYNRYYVQAPVYREAVEQIRVEGLQIVEADTDDQRALIAAIQMRPRELDCWFIFQEKGGVPNLLARKFPFYSVPYQTIMNEAGANPDAVALARASTSTRTDLHRKGANEILHCKQLFVLYSTVYQPGEPWFLLDGSVGEFSDNDFHPYWLSGELA